MPYLIGGYQDLKNNCDNTFCDFLKELKFTLSIVKGYITYILFGYPSSEILKNLSTTDINHIYILLQAFPSIELSNLGIEI